MLQSAHLPEAVLHRGPPVSAAENSVSFLDKWSSSPDKVSGPFVRDGCWHVFVKRKHTEAADALRRGLETIDAGKDLNALKSEVSIHEKVPAGTEILKAVSVHLDRRMPWERL
jgi:tRNA nucleotidyltransferase (CCA-adding enzyme)